MGDCPLNSAFIRQIILHPCPWASKLCFPLNHYWKMSSSCPKQVACSHLSRPLRSQCGPIRLRLSFLALGPSHQSLSPQSIWMSSPDLSSYTSLLKIGTHHSFKYFDVFLVPFRSIPAPPLTQREALLCVPLTSQHGHFGPGGSPFLQPSPHHLSLQDHMPVLKH